MLLCTTRQCERSHPEPLPGIHTYPRTTGMVSEDIRLVSNASFTRMPATCRSLGVPAARSMVATISTAGGVNPAVADVVDHDRSQTPDSVSGVSGVHWGCSCCMQPSNALGQARFHRSLWVVVVWGQCWIQLAVVSPHLRIAIRCASWAAACWSPVSARRIKEPSVCRSRRSRRTGRPGQDRRSWP